MNSDPVFILSSGEKARVEVISRSLAKEILSKPVRRRTWFGEKYWSAHRTSRGPGGAADYLNLALGVGQKYRAVMRFGTAPWGNSPVVAAVGPELAPRCCYLMRLWGSGISHADLVEFIRQANRRFSQETNKRFWYLLSLDSISGWIIDNPKYGIFEEGPPVAGKVYHEAGALYGGRTRSKSQPTRYIDPSSQQVKSVYYGGRNTITELRRQGGISFIDDGPKHRFVFVLAEPGSLEYMAYRRLLPPHIREWQWGENGLGIIQPRLLIRYPWLDSAMFLRRLRQFCDFDLNSIQDTEGGRFYDRSHFIPHL